MKRILALVLAFLLSSFALADVIEIDTETATLSEIDAALIALTEERNARLRAEAEKIEHPEMKDAILFRDVPWYSTKSEAESILGMVGGFHQDMQELPRGAVYQGIGTQVYYDGRLNVAGYYPTVRMFYVYPVIDGSLVKDKDLAMFYLAAYKFSPIDYGDTESIKNELLVKIKDVYGDPSYVDGDYYWVDSYGNTLKLFNNTWLQLSYYVHDAVELLEKADYVLDQERAAEEEQQRAMHTYDYEGL